MTKISIITICYNEPNLVRTCESVINQSYQDFEWIVIDGGSNNETQNVWRKYKNRINKFVSEKDNGIYNAMNKGIQLSTGEYLLFLNAGDLFYSNDVLEKISKLDFDKDIIYGDGYTIDGNNLLKKISLPPYITEQFFIKHSLCHPSTLIKKDLFLKYGMYDETLKIVSDWKKWIEFFKLYHCSYKYIPIIIAKFDVNGISSNKKYQKLHNDERTVVLNQYYHKEEISKFLEEYSMFEQIFSVKNSFNKKYKIITILGIKIKIKRKKRL